MRQRVGSELSFVSLNHAASATTVLIDSSGLDTGEYILYLESFDDAGGVYSTLKSDTITIQV